MAYLLRDSVGSPTSKMSGSLWYRANYTGASAIGDILQFGHDTWAGYNHYPCHIFWSGNATSGSLSFSFHGYPEDILNSATYCQAWDSGSGWSPYTRQKSDWSGPAVWTVFMEFSVSCPGLSVWTHLAFSVDTSTASVAGYVVGGNYHQGTFISGPKAYAVVNGVNKTISNAYYAPPSTADGNMWSFLSSENCAMGPNPYIYDIPVTNDDWYNFWVPGFQFYPINFGVPHNSNLEASAWSSYHPKFALADVQIWLNQTIDWRNSQNFSKVVNIIDGKGYPVNPSVATAAFGQQAILFKGKASDSSFWVNRGTGGAFSKVGTVSDFTPTPSY